MTYLKEGATQTETFYLGCYCTNLSDSWCLPFDLELFFLKKKNFELLQYQYLYRSSRNVDVHSPMRDYLVKKGKNVLL
jgi:hypothetical protein